ncbi:response regulator [Leptobacterium flavescens]|uniref:Response regulator n=1 Tax=Leptobacterium flavescens TaxID=472055 RepID=A0A6P0UM37_9FLAO|nr:LytTR family DNA-binding domain-containing protein [Leptobacterium flavescens]NER13632.1 response regulator [Leptobacterium flavescens]
MRCIIIDDEPMAHHIIEDYAKTLDKLTIVKSFTSAIDAIEFLHKEKVDLIFLDIKMPKLKGLDFIRTLSNPPAIVITSAYSEYALESYELPVSDYLLKPFSLERFLKAYNKVLSQNKPVKVQQQDRSGETPEESSIFLKGDKEIHHIKLESIRYMESYGGYVKIHLENKTILIHESLSHFEKTLSAIKFIRVHRSYIVNKAYIKSIVGNQLKLEGKTIPIGQSYKKNINDLLN